MTIFTLFLSLWKSWSKLTSHFGFPDSLHVSFISLNSHTCSISVLTVLNAFSHSVSPLYLFLMCSTLRRDFCFSLLAFLTLDSLNHKFTAGAIGEEDFWVMQMIQQISLSLLCVIPKTFLCLTFFFFFKEFTLCVFVLTWNSGMVGYRQPEHYSCSWKMQGVYYHHFFLPFHFK